MSDDEHEDQDESTEAYTDVPQSRKRKFNDSGDDTEGPKHKYRCLDMHVCLRLIILH
jgi:hypothetical protein